MHMPASGCFVLTKQTKHASLCAQTLSLTKVDIGPNYEYSFFGEG